MDAASHQPPLDPVAYSSLLAQQRARASQAEAKKNLGQFFTPQPIAAFMAALCTVETAELTVLDPGAGTGILSCALCLAQVDAKPKPRSIKLVAYEIDATVVADLEAAYAALRKALAKRRVKLSFEIRQSDFILDSALRAQRGALETFHVIIMNPPYFKVGKADPRALALPQVCHGQPNIYALFMAQAAQLLLPGGQLISITPRSFASGEYFRKFRSFMFRSLRPDRLHLFQRRDRAFKEDSVLQESVISRFVKDVQAKRSPMLAITSSHGVDDIGQSQSLLLPLSRVLDQASAAQVLRMPANAKEVEALSRLEGFDNTLQSLGCSVATGRIVAFRCQAWMRDEAGSSGTTAPLLWLHNLRQLSVRWPQPLAGRPQHFAITAASQKLLIPAANYVIVRRFSAKEEPARIVAAPLEAAQLGSAWLGVENHINVITLPAHADTAVFASALAAYLNSQAVDEYVRVINGNTQIGAAELLALPAPSVAVLVELATAQVDRSNEHPALRGRRAASGIRLG